MLCLPCLCGWQVGEMCGCARRERGCEWVMSGRGKCRAGHKGIGRRAQGHTGGGRGRQRDSAAVRHRGDAAVRLRGDAAGRCDCAAAGAGAGVDARQGPGEEGQSLGKFACPLCWVVVVRQVGMLQARQGYAVRTLGEAYLLFPKRGRFSGREFQTTMDRAIDKFGVKEAKTVS